MNLFNFNSILSTRKSNQSKKPKYMVIYWCARCEIDSGRTEIDQPCCFMCGRKDRLTEIKREKLTQKVMFNRMQMCTDRMIENLQKAHNVKKEDWPDNSEEEMKLLEIMAKGKDLQKSIANLKKKKAKSKQKHTNQKTATRT